MTSGTKRSLLPSAGKNGLPGLAEAEASPLRLLAQEVETKNLRPVKMGF